MRIFIPSAQASMALQDLYNLTLRFWEPAIFSGFLASFVPVHPTTTPPHPNPLSASEQDSTPSWRLMNVTPGGDWSFLGSTGNGTATRFTLNPEQRHSSTSRTDEGDSTQRIDDLIAAMEEGREAHERRLVAQAQAAMSSMPPPPDTGIAITGQIKATESALHLPTPEIDTSDSPSIACVAPGAVQHPSSICMSFSPSFRDLQKGKVGVWKGDLEIKGRGGGKFSVLIVGEEAMGYLCQSHTWPCTITYPPTPTPTESYTATMIPVSHLPRRLHAGRDGHGAV
ncbi:hypothetical protein EHS25_004831 [Saitozyma podzolica]|uniref:Uncharacterized protein n=1 Tax=Saitozyma podzolica TaxID=1890683 RepID=A0A427Y386_9TREE|nr:hypothetical protein EHS25_004831 [Saitozyma podzolica]